MLTVKSQRLLDQLGVSAALRKGAAKLVTGPVYELRKDPGVFTRLAFHKDDGVIFVGFASCDGGEWEIVDSEPFSFRALGYYERRLRRQGNFHENRDVEILG